MESGISGTDIPAPIINDRSPNAYDIDFTSKSIKQQQETDLNLSHVEGGLENAGRIETALSIALDNDGEQRKEKEKQKRLDILIQLEQLRIALMERITELQEEIDQLLELRDRVSQRLEALQQCLNDGRKNGRFEISDPLVAKAIREWEQAHGRSWNPEAEDAPEILLSIMKDHQNQYDDLSVQLFSKKQEQERLIQELNELDEKLAQEEISPSELERTSKFLTISVPEKRQVENKMAEKSATLQVIELGSAPKLR